MYVFEVGGEIEYRKREAWHKELLERVLSSVRCGILRFSFENDQQKITLANPAAWKLLGFEKEEECLNKSLYDILPHIHPEDRMMVLKYHCMLTKENDRCECEFRVDNGHNGYRRLDALMVSPYDDYIAYIDLLSSTEYTLHFYDIEKGKTVADFPVNPDYNGYRSCNLKIAFFGDHRCAIAGEEGIQIIDMNTLKVLWQGAKGMTVSASGDGSVVSVFNTDEKRLTFYTVTLLMQNCWLNGHGTMVRIWLL